MKGYQRSFRYYEAAIGDQSFSLEYIKKNLKIHHCDNNRAMIACVDIYKLSQIGHIQVYSLLLNPPQ
jgi:hypothetical protein